MGRCHSCTFASDLLSDMAMHARVARHERPKARGYIRELRELVRYVCQVLRFMARRLRAETALLRMDLLALHDLPTGPTKGPPTSATLCQAPRPGRPMWTTYVRPARPPRRRASTPGLPGAIRRAGNRRGLWRRWSDGPSLLRSVSVPSPRAEAGVETA